MSGASNEPNSEGSEMAEPRFHADAKTFLLQEHVALNEKLKYASEDQYRTETVISVAIAGLFVWILEGSRLTGAWSAVVHCVPLGLAVIGFIKQSARREYIIQLETYIRTIESMFIEIGGWETFFDKRRYTHSVIVRARTIYWIILFIIAVVFAIFGITTPSLPKAGVITP